MSDASPTGEATSGHQSSPHPAEAVAPSLQQVSQLVLQVFRVLHARGRRQAEKKRRVSERHRFVLWLNVETVMSAVSTAAETE